MRPVELLPPPPAAAVVEAEGVPEDVAVGVEVGIDVVVVTNGCWIALVLLKRASALIQLLVD
jgi:hypothetical protein